MLQRISRSEHFIGEALVAEAVEETRAALEQGFYRANLKLDALLHRTGIDHPADECYICNPDT